MCQFFVDSPGTTLLYQECSNFSGGAETSEVSLGKIKHGKHISRYLNSLLLFCNRYHKNATRLERRFGSQRIRCVPELGQGKQWQLLWESPLSSSEIGSGGIRGLQPEALHTDRCLGDPWNHFEPKYNLLLISKCWNPNSISKYTVLDCWGPQLFTDPKD